MISWLQLLGTSILRWLISYSWNSGGWINLYESDTLSSWWLNQPIWKICSSKWVHLPQFSGWKFPKSLSCHHLVLIAAASKGNITSCCITCNKKSHAWISKVAETQSSCLNMDDLKNGAHLDTPTLGMSCTVWLSSLDILREFQDFHGMILKNYPPNPLRLLQGLRIPKYHKLLENRYIQIYTYAHCFGGFAGHINAMFSHLFRPTGSGGAWQESFPAGEDATAKARLGEMRPQNTGVITLPETTSSPMEIPIEILVNTHQNAGFSRKLC